MIQKGNGRGKYANIERWWYNEKAYLNINYITKVLIWIRSVFKRILIVGFNKDLMQRDGGVYQSYSFPVLVYAMPSRVLWL